MNSYFRPAWLDVPRRSISTLLAISVLKAITAAVTWMTGCIIRLTTKREEMP